MDLIKAFTNEQLKAEVPSFSIGDTVRVEVPNLLPHSARKGPYTGI